MSLLPLELYREILRYLKQKILFKCKSVCKVWHDTLVNECVTHLNISNYAYRHERSIPLSWTFVNMKSLYIDRRCSYDEGAMRDEDIKLLTALTKLNLFNTGHFFSNKCISSLTNLTKLNCGHNSIITDKGISGLTKLTSLRCSYQCRISEDSIRLLTNLTAFACDEGRPITSRSVQYLTKLRSLECRFNHTITEGSLLRSLTNLERLDLSDNEMVRDQDISSLVNLTSLSLSCNHWITNQALRCFTKLRVLDISSARLISDKGIKRLTSLTSLSMYSNNVISNEGIRLLTNLTKLEFYPHYTAMTKEGLSLLTQLEPQYHIEYNKHTPVGDRQFLIHVLLCLLSLVFTFFCL